jgi:hypothetical protein
MVWLRSIGIFVVGFWWLWDISDLPLILTTSLTNLVCPKHFPIMALVCLNHYPNHLASHEKQDKKCKHQARRA